MGAVAVSISGRQEVPVFSCVEWLSILGQKAFDEEASADELVVAVL